MAPEKWLIHPGETRVIDLDDITHLKVGLVGGEIDIVAHDEPGVRIEVHAVTTKDLRISAEDARIEALEAKLAELTGQAAPAAAAKPRAKK